MPTAAPTDPDHSTKSSASPPTGFSAPFTTTPSQRPRTCHSTGPIIFAANHVSFYDPPAIGACLNRQINYFARDTLFKGTLRQRPRRHRHHPSRPRKRRRQITQSHLQITQNKAAPSRSTQKAPAPPTDSSQSPQARRRHDRLQIQSNRHPHPPVRHLRSLRPTPQTPTARRTHPHRLRQAP